MKIGTKSPKFRLPPIIPIDVIRYYYTVLADKNYKITIYVFLILTIAIGVVGIYTSGSTILILISTVGLLIGLYTFFYDFFKPISCEIMPSHEVKLLIQELEPSSVEANSSKYISLRIPYRDDTVIISRTVNSYLRECASTIDVINCKNKEEYIKDRLKTNCNLFRDVLLIKHRHSRSNNKMFFNENKISLAANILVGIEEVKCFKTSYFTSFLTNELSTLDIEDHSSKEEPGINWKGIDNFPYRKEGSKQVLLPLDESSLSNHIGGNTIGISCNYFLCLWRQASSAQRSEGLLAPTGSGSLDWQDFEYSNKTLSDMMICGMERELHEESTKTGRVISDQIIADTKLLGYYRWCGKGGLPGFVAISKLNISHDELQPNTAEVQNPQKIITNFPASDLSELTRSVDHILALPNLSVPLYVNLIFLKDVIKDDPTYLNFLFS